MINFITDIREGEADILEPIKKEPLIVLALNGELIDEIKAPLNGWTHTGLVSQADKLSEKTKPGAEAFLGSHWVGSTEV